MANLIEMDLPAIQGMDEILKPSDRPVMGNQRLVRFLPVPGTKKLFPCIWISPYITKEILETDGPLVSVAKCVVLISKGPPRPDIAVITMQPEDIEKFPRAPVEW